jgi:hypothetical protein
MEDKSYNQRVSNWLRFSAAAALAFALTPLSAQDTPFDSRSSASERPLAQDTPSLDVVLKRAASYVADFRKQLAGIIAEEQYTQQIVNTSRFVDSVQMMPTRRLKSDLLLVKPRNADRYVELRDTFEVDGSPVRDRRSRLELLLADPSAGDRIAAIIAESARYNIGAVTRNINTPLMALQFLDAVNQPRFRFRHVDKNKPVFSAAQDPSANASPVFRVTTEMWTIEYDERGRDTIIRKPDGGRQPAHGRFWIDPNTGSVLISELIVDGDDVLATVTVSYQSEPLMGFLVPIEMRESYVGKGERITGHAEYGRFRPIAAAPAR